MIKRFGFWMEKGFLAAALWSMFLTILIFAFMLVLGLPLFKEGRLLSLLTSPWAPGEGQFGIYPMIISTTVISFLSLCLGAPLALATSNPGSVTTSPGGVGRNIAEAVGDYTFPTPCQHCR